ncbi:MAG: nitroreductase family protein [Chloroflexi bacterium]|nr:nitroreductase family protein [Chloroflexota bacterium]
MRDALYAIIESRRSVRRYTEQPIAPELVQRLLKAAIWAPSAHNRQPWRFVVLSSAEVRCKLAAAMGERLRADLTADGAAPELIERDVSRSYSRISGAPVAILVCLSMADMDRYPDERRSEAEYIMAVQSVAMAAQNLLLAAHAEGLGACWMCAPLFCPDVVRNVLNLPADWQPQALITLGYPAAARESSRHALETRVLWR